MAIRESVAQWLVAGAIIVGLPVLLAAGHQLVG